MMSGRSSGFLSLYYLRILICADDIFAFMFRHLHMDGTVWPITLTDHIDHGDRLLVFHESFMLGQAVWPITLTMVIDCWFYTNHLCWVTMYDCSETEPTYNLHTPYIHTETHTWNTRTYKKLRHTSYKCLDIKIFKSIIYIYSNTQQQTPVLKVIWARFFTTYFCFIWHDEAILNNFTWQ